MREMQGRSFETFSVFGCCVQLMFCSLISHPVVSHVLLTVSITTHALVRYDCLSFDVRLPYLIHIFNPFQAWHLCVSNLCQSRSPGYDARYLKFSNCFFFRFLASRNALTVRRLLIYMLIAAFNFYVFSWVKVFSRVKVFEHYLQFFLWEGDWYHQRSLGRWGRDLNV